MLKKFSLVLSLGLGAMLFAGGTAWADSAESREHAAKLAEEGFEVQISLSEKARTLQEIKGRLEPYFTNNFIEKFIRENVKKTEQGYQTFGTDFAPDYIPYFSYTEDTQLILWKGHYYLVEYMPRFGGPVEYPSDYQGIRLAASGGKWKIDEVVWKLPQPVIDAMRQSSRSKSAIQPKNVKTDESVTIHQSSQSAKEKQKAPVSSGSQAVPSVFKLAGTAWSGAEFHTIKLVFSIF